MNYEEIKNVRISNIISSGSSEMKNLVKQSLSIVQSATAKDYEIEMLINAGVSDMIRQGIDVVNNIEDGLIQGAIVMFVKANFGMVDIKEKEYAAKTYKMICSQLSLSSDYKEADDNA